MRPGPDGETWLEPAELLRLVRRDVLIEGDESPESVIMRWPHLLVPVSAVAMPPLNLQTYRARRERWEAGEGPRVLGMKEFVDFLEAGEVPGRVAAIKGEQTNYVYILDQDLTAILAAVAIDPR